jgi:hypothetical protein
VGKIEEAAKGFDVLARTAEGASDVVADVAKSGDDLGDGVGGGVARGTSALKDLADAADTAKQKVDALSGGGAEAPGGSGWERLGPGILHAIPKGGSYREDMEDFRKWQAEVTGSSSLALDAVKAEALEAAARIKEIKMGDINSAAALEELGALEERLAGLKERLHEIALPHIKIEAIEDDLATVNKAIGLTAKLVEQPKKITVDDSQAVGAISRVKDHLAGIRDKTVTVRVNPVLSEAALRTIDAQIADRIMRGTSRIPGAFNP